VPCVVGNHGRLTRKPRAKLRPLESFDWLIYAMMAREINDVRGIKEIKFAISEGADYRYPVYSSRYQLTHGDQFRGGSGISGLLSPLMLGHHRKSRREASKKRGYDYLLMGHWHQLRFMGPLVVNGSLKGYDEYAEVQNYEVEPPQQAFWLTDPEWGMTIQSPVHVLHEDEPWRQHEEALLPTP